MEGKIGKMFFSIIANLKSGVKLPLFCSIILVSVCIILDSFSIFWIVVKNIYIDGTLTAYYFYFNSIIFSGIFGLYFIPILAAVPYATIYCKEYNSSMVYWLMAKHNKQTYCTSRFIANVILGGITVMLGIQIVILLLSIKLPFITDDMISDTTIFPFNDLLQRGKGFIYLLNAAYRDFLNGSLWATIALTISAYYPNKYFTIISPLMLKFIFIRIMVLLQIPNNIRLDYWLVGRASLDNEALTLILLTLVIVFIMLFCNKIFTNRVIRSLENE